MDQQAILQGFSYWRDRMREPALTVLLAAEVLAIFAVVPATGLPVYVLRSAEAPLGFLFALIIVAAIARGRIALMLTFLASATGITADLFRYEWPSALSTSIFLFALLACLLTISG